MNLKRWNPLTAIQSGVGSLLNRLVPAEEDQASPDDLVLGNQASPTSLPEPPGNLPAMLPGTTVTPAPEEQAKNAVPVPASEAGRAISLAQAEQDERMRQIMLAAGAKTEQFRREAESFDDEKASLGEKGLRFLFSSFAYIVPCVLAVLIGLSVGDAFTTRSSSFSYSLYAHFLSIALEMSLPILGFCVSLTFKRAAKDRAQVPLCAVLFLFFLVLGLGNAIVQVFMVTQNIGALNTSDQVAVLFRAGAPLLIDLICTFYLAVTGAKSLKRYLAEKRAIIEAVRDVSGINILLESQQNQSALNNIQAMSDMQSKTQRAATWNKLEALQAEKMVRSAERAMHEEDDDDRGGYGAYRRRRY